MAPCRVTVAGWARPPLSRGLSRGRIDQRSDRARAGRSTVPDPRLGQNPPARVPPARLPARVSERLGAPSRMHRCRPKGCLSVEARVSERLGPYTSQGPDQDRKPCRPSLGCGPRSPRAPAQRTVGKGPCAPVRAPGPASRRHRYHRGSYARPGTTRSGLGPCRSPGGTCNRRCRARVTTASRPSHGPSHSQLLRVGPWPLDCHPGRVVAATPAV